MFWEKEGAEVNMVQIVQRQSVSRGELDLLECLGTMEYQVGLPRLSAERTGTGEIQGNR